MENVRKRPLRISSYRWELSVNICSLAHLLISEVPPGELLEGRLVLFLHVLDLFFLFICFP